MEIKRSVGIIGTGWVGSSVAISTLYTGATQELLLYDKNLDLADGEAMDLSHGSSFYPSAKIRSTTPDKMLNTQAVVIAAGRGGKPDESRLDLLNDNVTIIRDLARHFVDYKGVVIMVSNPVDILTYEFQIASGIPVERVIGTGTMLDTARLRQILGRELDINPRSVHANVVGEHGDSEVVLWSSATIGGMSLRNWPDWSPELESKIAEEVRTAAQQIIQRKGATNHAIGLVTADLIKRMLRREKRIITISRVQTGALGIENLALSLPTMVGAEGATKVIDSHFDKTEVNAIQKSADVLRNAISSIN